LIKGGPKLVAVSGQVSENDSFATELTGQPCVISQVKEEIHLQRVCASGRIARDTTTVRDTRNFSKGFTLTDASKKHLHVLNAIEARGSSLTSEVIATDQAEKRDDFFDRKFEQGVLSGMAMLGVELSSGYVVTGRVTTERFVRCGAPITIVGEAASVPRASVDKCCGSEVRLLGDRVAVIRRPAQGGPFFIGNKSLQEIIYDLSVNAKLAKWAAIGCGTVGVGLITWKAASAGLTLFRRRRLKARVVAANRRIAAARAAGQVPTPEGADGERPTSEAADVANACCVCLAMKSDAVYTACGHMCTCWDCAQRAGNRCPMCRCDSTAVRVYM